MPHKKATILLLDKPDITYCLRICLENVCPSKIEVYETEKIEDALEILRNKCVNVLIFEPLTDFRTKDRDGCVGLNFLRTIKQESILSKLWVGIVTTGAFDRVASITEKAKEIAGKKSEVYIKPYDINHIIKDVKEALTN